MVLMAIMYNVCVFFCVTIICMFVCDEVNVCLCVLTGMPRHLRVMSSMD